MDFKKLKSNSGQKGVEQLNNSLAKLNTTFSNDERYWKPTLDAAGNGTAIFRFLPSPNDEEDPIVRYWAHQFKGPGGWYVENCLTTIGKIDPVAELNSKLWNSSDDEKSPEREQARKQARKLNFVSNIYVISDPGNRENEGKVFLYKYGKKIFAKLEELMKPEFEGTDPVNPFDFWSGANFKLSVRTIKKFPNYDASKFDNPKPLFEDDKKLEEIWKKEYSLQAEVDASKFKTYEELSEKLTKVLGGEVRVAQSNSKATKDDLPWEGEPTHKSTSIPEDESGEDEAMALFRRLASE